MVHLLSAYRIAQGVLILEVRPFEGTPEELSDFIYTQWSATYRGKMAVPHWSGDYLHWQLRMSDPAYRRQLIAVYQGTKLAGVFAHFPVEFELLGERIASSQQSWLSVAPEFRRQGAAKALVDGSLAVHRERGCGFQLGFTYYGRRTSLGPKFWLKNQMENSTLIRNAGFWVRVLDPAKAARWNIDRLESWLTWLATPLFPKLLRRTDSKLVIRPAQSQDIPPCLTLIDRATRHCQLRIVWDADSLSRQLGLAGYSHGLIAEIDGEVRGFITFHLLSMFGRNEAPVGVIDLVAVSELAPDQRNELVDAALLALQELGAVVALKLRVGDYPRGMFLRLGWTIRPADSHIIIRWISTPKLQTTLNDIHLLWR